jgi:ABC-type antimicrobial peptide transport system permease subunit
VAAIHSVSPEVAVVEGKTLEQRVGSVAEDTRFYTVLIGSLGIVSFALACVGLFGVLGYTVARRTHEFGVRFALGASTSQVRRLVLRQAAVLTVVGVVVGLVITLAGGRLLKAFLFELSPADPWTLSAALVVVCGGGLIAAFLPARRAVRVDPMNALRCE